MDNTRIVRNRGTGAYVNVDPLTNKAYEYENKKHATVFNDAVDELTDVDVLEYVTKSYGGESVELEIVPVKLRIDFRKQEEETA